MHPSFMLDKAFEPIVDFFEAFEREAMLDPGKLPYAFALMNPTRCVAVVEGYLFGHADLRNFQYLERMIKTVLWTRGGAELLFHGPERIFSMLQEYYRNHPLGRFDADFMARVYETPFTLTRVAKTELPREDVSAISLGGHLDGARIGFDAGGSDMKVAAVLNGEVLYSEEIVWHPKRNSDPAYHVGMIRKAISKAAAKLPRVDAIGVSAAGIYVENRVMVASLFIKVGREDFERSIKHLFIDLAKEWNVPILVVNDGDASALAGAIELKRNNLLGLAFGTSEAAGFIDENGMIKGWLNELCFVPVSVNADAPIDEWSGDSGCGSTYFSQDAVIRLAKKAGIPLGSSLALAEQLKIVQEALKNGSEPAQRVFRTIGVYLAYGLKFYHRLYRMEAVMILGRVVSGEGGQIILDTARATLQEIAPTLSNELTIVLPDESQRRVGQSIAAASLPSF